MPDAPETSTEPRARERRGSRFDEWQRNRLRSALLAFYLRRAPGGEKQNWKDVEEAIDLDTGVRIGYERLRQCVVGLEDRTTGRRHYSWPDDPEKEDAIAAFATDPERKLLSEEELRERDVPYQAAFRLLEYLDQDIDTERIPPPDSLSGIYRTRAQWDDGAVAVRELSLDSPTGRGVIPVRYRHEEYDPEGLDYGEPPAEPGRRAAVSRARERYAGWAVLTPEDNLLFFLKDKRIGSNTYYLTIETDISHVPDVPTKRLLLLHHHEPLAAAPESDTEPMNAVGDHLPQNLFLFRRAGEA